MARDTKQRLANSLKKLLSARTLDRITIKEIVEDCGINRQTFYYNFQDVYALLDWIFQQETVKLRINDPAVPWQEGFCRTVQYLKENEMLILNAYHSIGRLQLERYLRDALMPVICRQIQQSSEELHITPVEQESVAQLYVAGFLGIAFSWLDNDMSSSLSISTERLAALLEGILEDTLRRVSGEEPA